MKKGLLFLLFITLVLLANGQVLDNIRFIAGYPNYKYDLAGGEIDEVYNSAVLKPQGDSLVQEMLLCDSLNNLSYLRYYYSYHNITALLAQKKNIDNSIADQGYKLIVMDTRTMDTSVMTIPKTIIAYGEQYDFFDRRLSLLYDKMELSYVMKYENFDIPEKKEKPEILYIHYYPSNLKIEISNPVIYRSVIASGSSATPYLFNNIDGLKLQADLELNLLRIPSSLDIDSIYPLILPQGFILPSIYGANLIINSPLAEVLYFYEHTDTTVTYRILNKKTKQWNKLVMGRIDQGKLIMKDFGNWLVGCNRVSTTSLSPGEKLLGQDIWKAEETLYSPSTYKLLTEYEHFYSEGYMYLYNIDKKKYIEWNTGQADSEILMVKNDIVYYRVYDTIYIASIIDGEKLGSSNLFIKNKDVPAIHFMFIKGE